MNYLEVLTLEELLASAGSNFSSRVIEGKGPIQAEHPCWSTMAIPDRLLYEMLDRRAPEPERVARERFLLECD